jgi:hypothetical protein
VTFGAPPNRAKDILGRVYEYFLSQFASAEGKKGGQFYTPRSVVRVLVEMLAPYKVEDDGEPFEQKMARLTAELREQSKEAVRLDKLIWANLEDIGYGG